MYYTSQRGYGLGDLFRNITRKVPILNPVVKEAKGIGTAVGLKLAENLITDLVSGKSSKASAKERGKQARDMAVQRSIQSLFHKGNGNFDGKLPPSESDLGFSEKTAEREPNTPKSKTGTKRKRTESKSQPPAKKPKQSKKQSPKCTQKGGFLWSNIPGTTKGGGKIQKGGMGYSAPIWARMLEGRGKGKRTKSKRHPKTIRRKQSGGMPLWLKLLIGGGKGKKPKRVMKGKGWFESISRKIHKERDAECKQWQREKKRKVRKRTQAGSGGAYALNKLFGRGKRKKQKGKKRTGKKRNITKASLEDIFS